MTSLLPSRFKSRALAAALSFAALACGGVAQTSTGKTTVSPQQQQRSAAKRTAFAAFKAGDAATGVAQLTALAQTRTKGSSEDLEVGRQLADVAFQLHNERHAQASNVTQLALAKLAGAEGRMSAKEAAAAYALSGSLQEYVRGDFAQARRAYERAVGLDPTAKTAKQRLEHLNAIDEIARGKPAANSALAQRRQQGKGKS